MSAEQVPAGIAVDDWVATPLSVRELVLSLLTTVEALQKRIAELDGRLNQDLAELVQAAIVGPAEMPTCGFGPRA